MFLHGMSHVTKLHAACQIRVNIYVDFSVLFAFDSNLDLRVVSFSMQYCLDYLNKLKKNKDAAIMITVFEINRLVINDPP